MPNGDWMGQTVRSVVSWWVRRRPWWLPVVTGLGFLACLPPVNHETHALLAPMPLLSVVVLVPLLGFSLAASRRQAVVHSFLFGVSASASQYYWIVFDTAEGVWLLIIAGVIGICLLFGTYYLLMAMVFRGLRRVLPRAVLWVFPAVWVLGEYARTLGDISFPWMLVGYAWTPVLPLAQLAAHGGVYLLSFVIVAGNTVVWQVLSELREGDVSLRMRRVLAGYAAALVVIAVVGGVRLARNTGGSGLSARFCILQPNLDHLHRDDNSLDSAFARAEELVYAAAVDSPDCMVLPESALLTYLVRRPSRARRVAAWRDSTRIPLILGSLHWNRGERGSIYKYKVYNTAFLVEPVSQAFVPYFKMKLVPFSEQLPFEGVFPMLSRVNLGEADFHRGTEPVVFSVGTHIRAAPLICYEVIYPSFVRRRSVDSVNVLVNITNDSWFGHSPGPYHHAQMARLRSIENGISMVRCANGGISLFVDPWGRVSGRTRMFARAITCTEVGLGRTGTLYRVLGDWVVLMCALVTAVALSVVVIRNRRVHGSVR